MLDLLKTALMGPYSELQLLIGFQRHYKLTYMSLTEHQPFYLPNAFLWMVSPVRHLLLYLFRHSG